MTDTVPTGQRSTFLLSPNRTLTVTAGASSSGRVGRIGNNPGGGDIPASWQTVAANGKVVVGPWPFETRIAVEALAGSVSASMDEPTFPIATQVGKIEPFTGNRTLSVDDNGRVFRCEDGGNVTVTVPNNLGEGFNAGFIQYAAGTITLAAGSGATKRAGGTATSAQYQRGSLIVTKNSDGASAEYVVGGDFA